MVSWLPLIVVLTISISIIWFLLPTISVDDGIAVNLIADDTLPSTLDTVVIKTVSSQTIDGVNRTTNGLPLASIYTYYELISDGTNWWIK